MGLNLNDYAAVTKFIFDKLQGAAPGVFEMKRTTIRLAAEPRIAVEAARKSGGYFGNYCHVQVNYGLGYGNIAGSGTRNVWRAPIEVSDGKASFKVEAVVKRAQKGIEIWQEKERLDRVRKETEDKLFHESSATAQALDAAVKGATGAKAEVSCNTLVFTLSNGIEARVEINGTHQRLESIELPLEQRGERSTEQLVQLFADLASLNLPK